MSALCVSGNEHVVGVEVAVVNSRVREARDELAGAGQGLSACVPAVPSTPGAVAPEQHVSQGSSVKHELGDQICPVEEASAIYRCSDDARCVETQLFDPRAALELDETPRLSRPKETVAQRPHETAPEVPPNHPGWSGTMRVRKDRNRPSSVEGLVGRIQRGSVERPVCRDGLATPRHGLASHEYLGLPDFDAFESCQRRFFLFHGGVTDVAHQRGPTPYRSQAKRTRSRTSDTAIFDIRPVRGP